MKQNKTILRLKNKVSADLYTLLTTGRILYLHLKREWYSKIACGDKLEDYREITDYWGRRFISPFKDLEMEEWTEMLTDLKNPNDRHYSIVDLMAYFTSEFKKYDLIIFKNGYGDVTIVKFDGIIVKQGNENWGAVAKQFYFTLLLGNVLYSEPCS
jgi:hypothetical protein